MNKKHIVRLSKAERAELVEVVRRLQGTPQRVKRAQVLLKADSSGPNWTDERIAEAFTCTVQSIENLRKRFVSQGFDVALNGQRRDTPPRQKSLDAKLEAKVVSLLSRKPPRGTTTWSLRRLAEHLVKNGLVESISHETIRQVISRNATTKR